MAMNPHLSVLQRLHQRFPTRPNQQAEPPMCKMFHIHCLKAKCPTFKKLTITLGYDLLCATLKVFVI